MPFGQFSQTMGLQGSLDVLIQVYYKLFAFCLKML